jgi:hypothetical protein
LTLRPPNILAAAVSLECVDWNLTFWISKLGLVVIAGKYLGYSRRKVPSFSCVEWTALLQHIQDSLLLICSRLARRTLFFFSVQTSISADRSELSADGLLTHAERRRLIPRAVNRREV